MTNRRDVRITTLDYEQTNRMAYNYEISGVSIKV